MPKLDTTIDGKKHMITWGSENWNEANFELSGKYFNSLQIGDIDNFKKLPYLKAKELTIWDLPITEVAGEIEKLSVRDCPNLTKIPKKLKNLEINNCPKLKRIPENLQLERLILWNCFDLEEIPQSVQFKELYIEGFLIRKNKIGEYDLEFWKKNKSLMAKRYEIYKYHREEISLGIQYFFLKKRSKK